MRLLNTTMLAMLLIVPVAVDGQQSAVAVGNGARASVRASVGLTMPAMFRVAEVAPATATWQGERYTEYLVKYSVAANVQWAFAADALPHGVTLLARGGEWRGDKDSDLVVQRGAATNGTEILVRVRVADGASINWRNELRFHAVEASAATRFVAED